VESPKVAETPKAAEPASRPVETPVAAELPKAPQPTPEPAKAPELAKQAPTSVAEAKVVQPPPPPAAQPAAMPKSAAPQFAEVAAAKAAVAQANAAQAAREQALAAPLAAVQAPPPAAPARAPSPPPRVDERAVAAAEVPSAGAEIARGRIAVERADPGSVKQRASATYRAGQDAMSQGRLDEAQAQYAQTLRLDPAHAAARQALVVIMLDRNRRPEAQELLRDGLAITRDNSAWAMLLARIQVEGNDVPAALATLEASLPYARTEPDYLGVMATLLQMQGRHADAVSYYQAATQLSPEAGRWLIGLGLSLEELKRPAEAKEAYRRARDTGSLAREHQAFVNQKLRQIP
jgi:MSHA biogenesis protein MshN